ncbi:MAG: RNA-binding protein [Candidatus Roizmanbacteria bacterium]|nr:RNA-binding protein [Candidatus Roizmanbacteria bacterium]
MSTKLFVGSLSWDTKDDGLKQFFSQFGNVVSASVITYRDTGRSKGFGFVEYATEEEAKKALEGSNGQELDGRKIVVNEARPMQPRENNFRRDDRGGDRRDSRGGGRRGDY